MEEQAKVIINISGGENHVYPTAATVNNFFGDKFAEEANKAYHGGAIPNMEEEEKEVPDTLFAIIQDKKLYEETVRWAATCTRPLDIKNRICEPLRRAGFKNLGRDFAKALIPHLTHYECAKDINNIERSLL